MKQFLIGAAVGLILGATGMYLASPRSTIGAIGPTSEDQAKAKARMKDFAKHDEYQLQHDRLP